MNRAQAQRLNYNWDKVDKWINDNPDVPYPEFKKSFHGFPFSDATYYGRRRKLTGTSGRHAYTRKSIYETIGTLEMKEVTGLDALSAMKKLLALIDKTGKTHVEIVRLSDPDSIEIRRFTR
jgi:hypothetical protein